jgi:autoinducer 2 (AI-2) kinase
MMNKTARKYFLVLDLGTGSGRAVVFDDLGRELGYEAREWRHSSDPRYPGSVNFDTENNWKTLCECIQGAISKSGLAASQIDAVSATGMRLGTVFYDKDGEVLFACTNTDTRADKQTTELIDRGLGPRIYEIDGEWPGIGGPSVELLWLREHEPETFDDIAQVTMLTDWLLYKLSGEYSVDPSCAGTSGMFDGRKRQWSEEIAGWLDIPMDILAPVHESGTVIGEVTRLGAYETGLLEGIPVVQGGADAGCGLAGLAVVHPGQAFGGGGSFWAASMITDEMVLDPQARAKVLPHVVPDLWQLEGVCFYAGYMVRWFRDAFCKEEIRLSQEPGIDPYKILDEQAGNIPPGSYGVQASVAGVIDTKRWIVPPPTFMGWSIDFPHQSTKPVFYRALLENAAFQIRGTFELLYELTGHEIVEFPTGGGASMGHLWPQILADVTGKIVKVPVVKEGAALGAAMCAAVGYGVYKDLPEAAQAMVSWKSAHFPSTNIDVRTIYKEKYEQWVVLFDRLLQLADEGIMPPMWKAAGVRIGQTGEEH